MPQRLEDLRSEDLVRLEEQRSWVRDHFVPEARHEYEDLIGKLRLLQAILDTKWIGSEETWKLQSLGVTFGDALCQELGLDWVIVVDEIGRDPALHAAELISRVDLEPDRFRAFQVLTESFGIPFFWVL